MICPNKVCRKEIPNDSVFCDQCGVHLRQCTKCGSITLSKFCNECGGVVIDRKISELESSISENSSQLIENDVKTEQLSAGTTIIENTCEPLSGGTVIVETKSELKIIHSNFVITPASGDVLGRTIGPHSNILGQFPVISSRHGKVELLGDEWYFTDLHSSNRSYLNGNVITPDVPVKLSDGDKLVLANIPFIVGVK